ncbi:unnamed protein product [Heterobilharzia americana]|nr:unnamed protein product [Heterobilharzia americana]
MEMKPTVKVDTSKLKKCRNLHNRAKMISGHESTTTGDEVKRHDEHTKKMKRRNGYLETVTETKKDQHNSPSLDLKSETKSKKSKHRTSTKKAHKKFEISSKNSSKNHDSVQHDKDQHGGKDQARISLMITNLPKTINYAMLRDSIPSARRIKLYKKSAKRQAFANFTTMEEYTDAVNRLEELNFDGIKPSFKQVVRYKKSENTSKSDDLRLTIQNLPYSITTAELEDEFPTAKSIIINTKKDGTNKGSCLIEFECKDDLQVVLDACQNKEIGGRRPNYCQPKTMPSSYDNSDDEIRKQFLPGSMVEYCSVPCADPSLRNVFISFKNTKPNQLNKIWHKKGIKTEKSELKPATDKKRKSRKLKHESMDISGDTTEPIVSEPHDA